MVAAWLGRALFCCRGPGAAAWLRRRCFGRQSMWYDSVAGCHWTRVVAITAGNYRCCNFINVLFPELCILAHFKRRKQPTISVLINKWRWWETKEMLEEKMPQIIHRIRHCGSQSNSHPAASLLALWGDVSSLWSHIFLWHLCVL